jgi:Flp pilus assembly protein TadD
MNEDSNNFNLLYKLGRCYDRRRDYGEAVEFYNKALKLDPNSAEVAFKLGYSLVRNEQKEMGLN